MATTTLYRAASTATLDTKYTLSMWIKRSTLDSEQTLIGVESGTTVEIIKFNADNNFYWYNRDAAGNAAESSTAQVFRDVGAFYNLVFAYDSTQASAADQKKIYINGVATAWGSEAAIQSNAVPGMNLSGATRYIGREGAGTSYYYEGLMSYVSFVDGTAYDQSYFGETDSSSGIWKIKTSPSVTYGNNGFFLKMDTSSPGTDTSGNNNTFTASGTPTLTQDNASNNFATFNSVYKNFNQPAFTNGNLTATSSSSGYHNTFSTIAVSTGKWYAEFKRGSSEYQIGISSLADAESLFPGTDYYIGETSKSLGISRGDGKYRIGTSATTYGASYASGDIIGIALDLTNKKLYASKNGAWSNGSGAWSSSTFDAAVGAIDISSLIPSGELGYIGCSNTGTSTLNANFGSGFFGTTAVASANADANGHGIMEYAVPSGFYTLNTKNLKEFG